MKKIISLFIVLMIITSGYSQTPQVSSGKIERIEKFKSSYVTARNIDIWLPEDYTEEKQYAVLYMNDGQMLFDSNQTWNGQEWKVDEVVSALLKEELIRDCIVVGIWNDSDMRWSDYNPQKALGFLPDSILDIAFSAKSSPDQNADNYLRFVVKELKPLIDKKYATLSNQENTFIMGSSMGGLISMYAICEYPEIFGGAGCLSTHWVGDPNNFFNEVPEAYLRYLSENLPDPENHKIYFDFGTETLDQYYEPWQTKVDELMEERGYGRNNWVTKKFEGEAHTEEAWAERLHIPLEFLLGN